MAKLTLIGLYNYDPTLFSELTLPEGIDGDVLIPEILRRAGEFELLYPNLTFLKSMIGQWGKKHQRTFEKWIEALNIEYDPLFNFDRNEEYTDAETTIGSNSRNQTSASVTRNTSSESHDVTRTNGGTSQNDVSAYDQTATFSPKDKRTDSFTDRDAGSSSVSDNGGVEGNENETGSNREEKRFSHTARLFGNIGVTTSQQMLRDQLEVVRWNVYEQIADLFVDEFCIMIYV